MDREYYEKGLVDLEQEKRIYLTTIRHPNDLNDEDILYCVNKLSSSMNMIEYYKKQLKELKGK